jgi:enoyl-CoA hydratase/carnithine racemase
MTQHVEISRRGSSLEIQFDRTDKKNAVTGAMYAAMAEAIASVEAQADVVSIVFAGRGAAFCAGNDLQDFLSTPMTPDAPVLAFLKAISSTSKVMIAAVQGPCVGIGATLLLHCDHVVAAPSAGLAFNFVKMALVPEAGSSLLLPRAVGRLKAAELMLLGEPVGADEALRIGLVSRVVAEGEQLEAARAFADKLERLPPAALIAARQLLNGSSRTVEARIAEEVGVFGKQLRSPEFKEAVAAFMQKRPPVFRK